MQIPEANIEIQRNEKALVSVSVVMPVWDKRADDGSISISIPLFNMKTFAKSQEEVEVALEEAIHAFCFNAERFGRGLESELQSLGWSFSSCEGSVMIYSVSDRNVVLEQIMTTGDQYARTNLQLA